MIRVFQHGIFPGTDPKQAAGYQLRVDSAHFLVPTQPARGPGSDIVGRTLATCAGISCETQPYGWRVTSRSGIDQRRINTALADDLHACFEALSDAGVQRLKQWKIQFLGPLSLAATLHLASGHKVISDAGAMRDIFQAQAAGSAQLLNQLQENMPAEQVAVEIIEHRAGAALAGAIPTASGYQRHHSIEPQLVHESWAQLATTLSESISTEVQLICTLAGSQSWSGPRTLSRGLLGQTSAQQNSWQWDEHTTAWLDQLLNAGGHAGFHGFYLPSQLSIAEREICAPLWEKPLELVLGVPAALLAPTPGTRAAAQQLLAPWQKLGLAVGAASGLQLCSEADVHILGSQEQFSQDQILAELALRLSEEHGSEN